MFQPDPRQWPIQPSSYLLPPQFRGGVAPLRCELALSDYLAKQQAHRDASEHGSTKATARLRSVTSRAGRRLLAALHLDYAGFGIGLRDEVR
jgi:hypothetical protein